MMNKKIVASIFLFLSCTLCFAKVTKSESEQILKEREAVLKDEVDAQLFSTNEKASEKVTEKSTEKASSNQNLESKENVSIESKTLDSKIETQKAETLKESDYKLNVDTNKNQSIKETSVYRLLASFGLVFVILAMSVWGLRNWSKKRGVQNNAMKIRVLTQHFLGPKKSLAIIQVAGESILIGVTDHNISMLKTLALIDDEIPANEPNKFDSALYDFEEEEGEIQKHFSQNSRAKNSPDEEPDHYALKGISEIRDVVSKRLKGMRSLE